MGYLLTGLKEKERLKTIKRSIKRNFESGELQAKVSYEKEQASIGNNGVKKRNRVKIITHNECCDLELIKKETRRMLCRLRQTTGNKNSYEVTISLLRDSGNSQEGQTSL